MAGSLVIMTVGEDGIAEGVIQGDINMSFIGENMVIIFPVREMRPEYSKDILERGLQVLKDKRI